MLFARNGFQKIFLFAHSLWLGKLSFRSSTRSVFSKFFLVVNLTLFCSAIAVAEEYYFYSTDFRTEHFGSVEAACNNAFVKKGYAAEWTNDGFTLIHPHIPGWNCHAFIPTRYVDFTSVNRAGDSCSSSQTYDVDNGSCDYLYKSLAYQESSMTCRPINIGTGNKFYQVIDYQGVGNFPVSLTRYYNSFAGKWSWNYLQDIAVTSDSPRIATIHRPDGKQFEFTEMNGSWLGDSDVTDQLFNDGSGFKYVLSDDTTEFYDANGRLTSIHNREGLIQTLTHGVNQITISDSDETVVLTLDNDGQVTAVNAGGSVEYRYGYKASGLLEHIALPDATPGQSGGNPFGEDNPYQTVHYEDANYPDHVTGITDENGDSISTVQYDAQGRAISSEVSNGIEKTILDYSQMDSIDPRITVTNELGKDTTYHYTTIHGVRKVTQVESHASDNCAAANQSYTYDANGFKDEVTDWEGNKTDYDHDARGLEIQRIEAKGSAHERTITTEWHTDFRLPTKITEPDRVIEFSYDTQGLLLERNETPVP